MLSKVAENPPELASVLHIADGDCRADELRAQSFAGTIVIYGDLL